MTSKLFYFTNSLSGFTCGVYLFLNVLYSGEADNPFNLIYCIQGMADNPFNLMYCIQGMADNPFNLMYCIQGMQIIPLI